MNQYPPACLDEGEPRYIKKKIRPQVAYCS